jgi:outer membrane protein
MLTVLSHLFWENTMKRRLLTACFVISMSGVCAASDLTSIDTMGDMNILKKELSNSVGVGLFYSQSIYNGASNTFLPIPVVHVDYDGFFFHGYQAGYSFIKQNNAKVSLLIKPNLTNYSGSDSDALAGMEGRKISLNAGLQASYRYKLIKVSAAAVHDVTDRTNGSEVSGTLAAGLPLLDNRLLLTSLVSLSYQDSRVVNYYYGVKDSEATSGRSAYTPGGALNWTAGVAGKYAFAEHWKATLGYYLRHFGSAITDSPIVDRSYSSIGILGVSYVFD